MSFLKASACWSPLMEHWPTWVPSSTSTRIADANPGESSRIHFERLHEIKDQLP